MQPLDFCVTDTGISAPTVFLTIDALLLQHSMKWLFVRCSLGFSCIAFFLSSAARQLCKNVTGRTLLS